MSDARGKTSRPWDPQHSRKAAQSPEAKRPPDDRVFFVLETVPRLDVRRFYAVYEEETRGAPPFAPQRMVCVLLYADGVGGFLRRTLAQACERNLAFLAIVGADRPDCRPLSDFRPLPLEAFGDVCVAVWRIAGEAGWVQLGHGSPDGTTLQGHASQHNAMRYGYRKKEVDRWREEIAALVTLAYQQDTPDDAARGSRRGDERPAELARRADRLATIEAARRRWAARANADAAAERQRRAAAAAARQRRGKPRRGTAPTAVEETPADKAPMRCTDPEWGIRPTNNTGGDDGGNAQGRVDAAHQIIGACAVTAAAHAKQHARPMAQLTVAPLEPAGIKLPQDATGAAQKSPATYDSGSYRETAAAAVAQWGCAPSMATGRQRHHGPEAEVREAPTTAKERRAASVQSPEGRALYARRTVIVAPVCGQSKAARGFRRFLRRGWAKIRGEWCLVCLTHNLLKVWRYACAPCPVSADEMVPQGPTMDFFQTTSLK